MTADVISLSELSDEPIAQPEGFGFAWSERLAANLDGREPTSKRRWS